MLPHLAGRPLTLQRYPDGIDGEEWYQQNAPDKTPPFVRLVDSGARHEHKKRIVCDSAWTRSYGSAEPRGAHDPPVVLPRAALGVSGRAGIDHALAVPDYVVLDLDPGDGPWAHLIQVALAVQRTLLEALELESVAEDERQARRSTSAASPSRPGPPTTRRPGSPSASPARWPRCCRTSPPSSE